MALKKLSSCASGFVSTFGKVVGKENGELEIEHRGHRKKVLWARRPVEMGEWIRVHGTCRGNTIESQLVQSLEGMDICLFEKFCDRVEEFSSTYREIIGTPPPNK